jgi:tRNA modification GTPase
MDLTSAEGINDLINAETNEQRKQALRQMSGELADLYENWQNRLKKLLAHLEAYIDFPEEDIPNDLEIASTNEINAVLNEIKEHLADNHKGEILRQGYSIAIIGAPNAGKSSLLNKLVKRDAAIVSSMAGTTRDIIEVFLDIDGFPVILADTAGLREAKDMIEEEGIKRALKRAASANLKLAVFDGAKYPEMDKETVSLCDKNTLKIINKSDLVGNHNVITKENDVILTNSLTGKGLDAVLDAIKKRVSDELSLKENPALTQIRHREALTECAAALSRSLSAPQTDLKAEDLRLASRAIGKITGQITVDEVLDIVFKEFCIGK